MKLKRRSGMSGVSFDREFRAWSLTFRCGTDYFRDLKKIGIAQDTMKRESFLKMAQASWNRLGPAFLKTWEPTKSRPIPWAQKFWSSKTILKIKCPRGKGPAQNADIIN